jgi:hypothetical protein
LSDIALTGSVSGDTATFQGSFYCAAEGKKLTLSFTNAVIDGDTLEGYYNACYFSDPSTCVDSGDFYLTASQVQLTVTTAGAGSGSVSSDPAGINSCRGSCWANFNEDSHVILTATPDSGSILSNWSVAGCSAPGACTVTMNAEKTAELPSILSSCLAGKPISA